MKTPSSAKKKGWFTPYSWVGIAAFLTVVVSSFMSGQLFAAEAGVGILGDSLSAEYEFYEGRGGIYAATTRNWAELLAQHRGLNLGTKGSSGYAYNWAASGATSNSMINGGQHTSLAAQVAAGNVTHAIIMIGANDFSENSAFYQIYEGTLAGQAITNFINGIVNNVQTAVDTLKAAGPVQIYVVKMNDLTLYDAAKQVLPDPVKRQRFTDAIVQYNNGLQSLTTQPGVASIDLFTHSHEVEALADANRNINIGGEFISLSTNGDEPHHMLLDGSHPGTIMGALWANEVMEVLNTFGFGLPLFSHSQMLSAAGITPPSPPPPPPADTTSPTVSLTTPASGAVVSGAISVSANASDNIGVVGVQFKLDGVNLGSEDTSAPYSVSWNTTTASNGSHTLTATVRDAAGNQAASSRTVTVSNAAQQTYSPAIYTVTQGAYQSGNAGSLTSNNDNFLVVRSTTSGSARAARTEFEVQNVALTVARLDLSIRLKSNVSSTNMRIYAYNFTTAQWVEFSNTSIGSSEVTRSISITTGAANYKSAGGRIRIATQSSRGWTTHIISHEVVQATVIAP